MDNISKNYNAKIVLGVRCSPQLKFNLTNEAAALGLTVSAYAENFLLNRNRDKAEIDELKQQLAQQQESLEKMNRQLELMERIKKENDGLKSEIGTAVAQTSIYNDRILIYLYENLKGKEDLVENEYGEDFLITYKSPKEVLQALIYSCKLKK